MPGPGEHVYTKAERATTRLRCPECRAPLAITWRRARQPGRSEDLYTIAKTFCRNRCDYDPSELSTPDT
jgi:hypothetical protein